MMRRFGTIQALSADSWERRERFLHDLEIYHARFFRQLLCQ